MAAPENKKRKAVVNLKDNNGEPYALLLEDVLHIGNYEEEEQSYLIQWRNNNHPEVKPTKFSVFDRKNYQKLLKAFEVYWET